MQRHAGGAMTSSHEPADSGGPNATAATAPLSPPAPAPPGAQRNPNRLGVLAAAGVLVLATWGALTLAGNHSDDGVSRDGFTPSGAIPGPLPGFRADASYLPDDDMLGFVEIPGGPFTMGSDPGVDRLAFDVEWWGEGRVQGHPDVPTFYLGRFEVTTAQFAAFTEASGHRPGARETLAAPPTHPVTYVSWTDAVAYARWLDETLRSAPSTPPALSALLHDGWSVRLPGEDQWEKAARGEDARIYPWGNTPRPDRARYGAAAAGPVGTFLCPECVYGLSDMSGNVWEWTRSPYQPYPYTLSDDHDDLASEALWVIRGGSFQDTEQFIRSANRGGADPGARRSFIGFRVALVRH